MSNLNLSTEAGQDHPKCKARGCGRRRQMITDIHEETVDWLRAGA